jgi:pyridoxal-phosphate dependent enzyme
MDLTPVENRNGLWLKREDLLRDPISGVNGAKYRACRYLINRAKAQGYHTVVSAASVLSPQSAMAAVIADEVGMACRVIVGGTTPEKAVLHRSIGMAAEHGAQIEAIKVGYNPALQSAAKKVATEPGVWRLPYGITTDDEIEPFLAVGGSQTMNLPDEIETLIIPFGSGNTACGVLYGLHDFRPSNLKQVVLIGIGPDRLNWTTERLAGVGRPIVPARVALRHASLHGWFASYGDKMPETLEGIVTHPTYEGKVVRFLNSAKPDYWTRRDGTTCFWIIGGPI